jgi:hypothetical protein
VRVDGRAVRERVAAWMGHARQGHTRALCANVLSEFVFVRDGEGCDHDDEAMG